MCVGVPVGDMIYVLRRDTRNNDVEIWDAISGDPYFFKRKETFFGCFGLCRLNRNNVLDLDLSDNEYPLQEIGKMALLNTFLIMLGCVANNENIWVNVQADASPSDIIFDIENKKHWIPFLG